MHGAFTDTRALQGYVDALEFITISCLDRAVELANQGCNNLDDMFRQNQELIMERRDKKLLESPLQVHETCSSAGQVLKENGESVGEAEFLIKFADDGYFAYYEGAINSFTRRARLSSADILNIKTTIKGKDFLLKSIAWLDHPFWLFDLVDLARGQGKPVCFRADDIESEGEYDDRIHT